MEGTNTLDVLAISRHRMETDGPGVTTLVGLAGCSLNCRYCLNYNILHLKKPRRVSVQALYNKVMQDYCYFVATGGGVTFGGGEPLLQYKGLEAFASLLGTDVGMNIETSLNTPKKNLIRLVDKVSSWIIDIKDLDPFTYEKYTGYPIENVIDNLVYFSSIGIQSKCTIRVPLIPGFNNNDSISKTVEWLNRQGYNVIDRFEYDTENRGKS